MLTFTSGEYRAGTVKNKEIEEYYFEMFRRDYALPDGAVEYGDKPDVILRGARTVGIEITNFFLEEGSHPGSVIVRAKEDKSREYRPCDAYWLLVVVDFIDRAQDQEIPAEGLKNTTSQVFEKIIVYKTCFGYVAETLPSSQLRNDSNLYRNQ